MSWELDDTTGGGWPDPGVTACYRSALRALASDLAALFTMGIVVFGLAAASWHAIAQGGAIGLVGCLFAAFVATPVAWSFDYVCLRAARGEPIRKREVQRFKRRYGDVVLANVVVSLCVIAGLFLLVVPGVVLFCRLRFVPYLIIDEDLAAGEALRESLDLTRGYTWPIFWISLVGLLLVVAGLPLLVLGAAVGDALARLATASFYHATVEPSRGLRLDDPLACEVV